MFCRYCGQSIAEDSVFCSYCGKNICDNANNVGASTEHKKVKSNSLSDFFIEYLPLIVRTLFYGWWKFLIYVVEAVFAVCLTALTKSKISECKSLKLKILSIIVSTFIILSSITLRIVYEVKVDIAEKDLPSYGTVLVEISYDTDYYTDYSYIGGVVYDPSTSIKVNGASDHAKITLGQTSDLEIKVNGNHESGAASDTINLHSNDFVNGTYSITKTVNVGGGISAAVEVKLRRYCTFFEVIFY